MRRRRTVLVVLIVSLAPAFAITQRVVASYRDSRQRLAAEWAARGSREIDDRPADAVEDFRTALAYSTGNPDYRLQLARALLVADRPAEAEAHLLTLWSAEPGDGTINLELGRLAVRSGDIASATRYYHAAIDGAWPENAAVARRTAQIELARALLGANRREEAQAELIRLAGDVPDDSGLLTEVGDLLRRAGAETRAMTVFRRALDITPTNARAAMLAGETAFDLGDYETARQFLRQASTAAPLDAAGQDALQVSDRVLRLDPFARGLPLRERARRTIAVFDIARTRLEACRAQTPPHAPQPPPAAPNPAGAPPSPSQNPPASPPAPYADLAASVDGIADRLKRPRVERDDDLLDEALEVAFRIEQLPSGGCGPRSTDDRAVALLARERQDAAR